MLARVRNRRGIAASVALYGDNETGVLHLFQVKYKDHDSPRSERHIPLKRLGRCQHELDLDA